MAGFRLLRRARADLLDIGAFTADRWGDDQAERYETPFTVPLEVRVGVADPSHAASTSRD